MMPSYCEATHTADGLHMIHLKLSFFLKAISLSAFYCRLQSHLNVCTNTGICWTHPLKHTEDTRAIPSVLLIISRWIR